MLDVGQLRQSEACAMLSESIDKLPPLIKREVMDYIEFLTAKYRRPSTQKPMTFAWSGALSHLKDEFTSVKLQHKSSEWR
jgi:uncharacterized protein